MLSSWFVRLIYEERVSFISERLFRSRDIHDLDVYLGLTATARFAFAAGVFSLGLLIGLWALRDAPGLAGRLARGGWRGVQGLVTWSPVSPPAQAGVALVSGAGIALASGYRAVPSLENDVVTYMPVARKYFDDAYLLGDLPIRDPDGALVAWGAIIRALAMLFGFEGAFFAVSLLGGAILAYGIHRLVATAIGAGHRAGMLAVMVGLTITFGSFGYTLSIPSHAAFYPTPRFLAIAISVVAISLVLERAFIRGVLLGLVSTAVNTLDGLIPVGLAILAVLLVGDAQGGSRRPSRRLAVATAVAAFGMTVTSFAVRSDRLPGAGTLAGLLPDSLTIVTVGAVVGLIAWLLGLSRGGWGAAEQARVLAAGATLAVGGVLLASRRSTGGDTGFLEGVRAFETVLVLVRQSLAMLVLSATSVSSALLFVALLLVTIALVLDLRVKPPGAVMSRPHRGELHAVLLLAVLSAGFVALGSNLMERTNLPFLVTLWPARVAWVVVLVFVAAIIVKLEQHGLLRRVGSLPAFAFGLMVLQGVAVSRALWSVGLLGLACVWVIARGSASTASSVTRMWSRPAAQVLVVAAAIVAVVPLIGGLAAPEVRIADSMRRLEADGGRRAEVVQMARAANATTSPDARILIPPGSSWGAFRLLSDRGVAFEWKNFSAAQPFEWYEQLRWMCDPSYRIGDSEAFTIGGRDVERCHVELSAVEILQVADIFEADFAVVRSEIAHGMSVIGMTDSGDHALVRLR